MSRQFGTRRPKTLKNNFTIYRIQRLTQKHSKHVFWGLTKNTEKYFYHLGFLPSNRIQRLTHKHSKTRVFSSPINTQKHVFLGLTKNTEKHFYHLRQGRAIHNTQYKYNTIQYNSLTIRINTQYTKCLEGNTCIIKSLSPPPPREQSQW